MPIPIPKRPLGYRRGLAAAPVQIDAFVDIQCPFSKKAWFTVLEIVSHYGTQKTALTVYPISLPNHRQSWDVTKAAIAFAQKDSEQFIDVFSYLYVHQQEFENQAFRERTQVDLHNLLADLIVSYGANEEHSEFKQHLASQQVSQMAKVPNRIAAVQGVWSTPTFFINQAEVTQLSSSSTLQDWQAILDPLFE